MPSTMSLASSSFWKPFHDFLHARTGPEGCRLGGYIRIGFASLFLIDRIILGLDLDKFFSPTTGYVPYKIGSETNDSFKNTIFALAPDSELLLWSVYIIGILQGILLLLGIGIPRLQVLGIYWHLIQFHHHNKMIWDAEDVMLRMWAFMLLFMPLNYVTLNDGFGKTKTPNHSWPMWPWRLWQIYMCYVYIGASVAKFAGEPWRDGTALYLVSYEEDFYGMFFNPSWLFNRLGPIKFLTWSSLFVETACLFTIWPLATRNITLISLVLLHVGIDLSMNMHVLEYVTLLGWMVFIVRPMKQDDKIAEKNKTLQDANTDTNTKKQQDTKSPPLRHLFETFFFVTLLVAFFLDSFPASFLQEMEFHPAVQPHVTSLCDAIFAAHEYVYPVLLAAGCDAYVWCMFGWTPDHCNNRFEAKITIGDNRTVFWQSPEWTQYSLLQKKRHMRLMNFYENMEDLEDDKNHLPVWRHFCEYLAREYGPNVSSVELIMYVREGMALQEEHSYYDWFEELPRSWENYTEPMYYLDMQDRRAPGVEEMEYIQEYRAQWKLEHGVDEEYEYEYPEEYEYEEYEYDGYDEYEYGEEYGDDQADGEKDEAETKVEEEEAGGINQGEEQSQVPEQKAQSEHNEGTAEQVEGSKANNNGTNKRDHEHQGDEQQAMQHDAISHQTTGDHISASAKHEDL